MTDKMASTVNAATASGSSSSDRSAISTLTAGSLTTYELRQELVRRQCLDIPEERINHRTMLERLMTELVAEERTIAEERAVAKLSEEAEKREAARLLREQKKLEALERSRQRQADATYFKLKQDRNEDGKKKLNESRSSSQSDAEPAESFPERNDESIDREDDGDNDDPFRTIATKQRSKIFVR